MPNLGIIWPSTLAWSSPLVLVPKKRGEMRLCTDYWALNKKTLLDGFSMPQVHEILDSLYGAVYFSTLDLRRAYWQIEMDPNSISKTFVPQNHQYEILWLPFGLKNSAATFQWLMNTMLAYFIGKICIVYIDDIVIYSWDILTHLQHLQQVFACLQSIWFTLNLKKCQLCQCSLSFLGHVTSGEGIWTKADKVEAICAYPTPTNIKELQRFIGLAG